MRGELLADKPSAQIVICSDATECELVRSVLTDQIVILYDPEDGPDEYACLKDRDVIALGAGLPLIFMNMAKPAKLRYTDKPIPATLTAKWVSANLDPYITANPELRHVQPLDESAAQGATGGGGSPSPSAPSPVPDAADPMEPPDADLNEPLPDVPEHLENGPDDDLSVSRPINGQSHVWVASEAEEWGIPQELFSDYSRPAEMDPWILPEWIAVYVTDCAARIGCDVGGVVESVLVGFSSLIDDRFSVQVKQHDTKWCESGRLWALVLGDSSTKKNASIESATELLEQIDQEARKAGVRKLKDHALAVEEYQARRKEYISKQAKLAEGSPQAQAPIEPDPVEADWFICQDYTPESLAKELENQAKRKVFITGDEPSFLAFDRYASGKQSAGRTDFLSLYQGRPRNILRIGNGIGSGSRSVPSWSACVLAGSTPSSLRTMLGNSNLAGDGLLQRCLINVARLAVRGEDRAPNAQAFARFERACRGLFAMRCSSETPFRFAPDANELFAEFEDYIQRETENPIYSNPHKSHISKWSGKAPRIALTLWLAGMAANGQEPTPADLIDAKTMQCAIDLLTLWQGPQLRYFWDVVLAADNARELNNDLQTVAEVIACYHLDDLTVGLRDIQNSFKAWKNIEPRTQSRILASLQDMAWIIPRPGAKSRGNGIFTSYSVNPRVRRYDDHPAIVEARKRRALTAAGLAAKRGLSA